MAALIRFADENLPQLLATSCPSCRQWGMAKIMPLGQEMAVSMKQIVRILGWAFLVSSSGQTVLAEDRFDIETLDSSISRIVKEAPVRLGPGEQFTETLPADRAIGRHVRLSGRTSVQKDGFNWFLVTFEDTRSGFVWGGDLCSYFATIEGTLGECTKRQYWGNEPENPRSVRFMAFANTPFGQAGHGVGEIREAAERWAMKFCDDKECAIEHVTEELCHAVFIAPEGSSYGAGSTGEAAKRDLMETCGDCEPEYIYCRAE